MTKKATVSVSNMTDAIQEDLKFGELSPGTHRVGAGYGNTENLPNSQEKGIDLSKRVG